MSEYAGAEQIGGAYAPADFGDAQDTAPTAVMFDVGGHGLAAPYTAAVNAILTKQIDEIRKKVSAEVNLPTGWKRRLREFMSKKNNDLLDFLKVSVPQHPTLGPGELLIRKFGNPQVTPSHASVRDMVIDVSGENVHDEIHAAMLSLNGDNQISNYALHTRMLYDLYREAGEAIFEGQAALKGKLDRLDRIQGKVNHLFEIDVNEKYEPLLKVTEEYLQKIFEQADIEVEYNRVVLAYRRFSTLRDIITMSRTFLSAENEPLCSICLNETVSYALVPCGHTFCQTCMRRQYGDCFMCRNRIKDKVKLYFG